MSWAPGRGAIVAMLDRRELEIVVEQAAIAQFSGSMGALLRPLPRMRSTRNDTEYPDRDTQIEPDVVLADLDKAREIVQACRKVLPHLRVFQR